MERFLSAWSGAASTSAGLFWSAFWAFGLGYVISSLIQVLVTEARMRRTMGDSGARSLALGTFFGFVSSSCSFAALSTTRSLFAKGAGLSASLAFLLASTNLVVELGIVIAVFLSWQFVVGEYVGGLLLILVVAGLVRLTRPRGLVDDARERARSLSDEGDEHDDGEQPSWRELVTSRAGWRRIASAYVMEWSMVWRDVAIGFAVAGAVATLVPASFFRALFVGSGDGDASFLEVLAQAVIGPLAAVLTFIGSMGNVPLAAVLFGSGVSFAGVMAFLFSDLVVLPALRIQARYYGWRMALYIAGLFLVALVATSVALHYAFAAAGLMPDAAGRPRLAEREFFAVDHTLALNLLFLLTTGALLFLRRGHGEPGHDGHSDHGGGGGQDGDGDREGSGLGARALSVAGWAALAWIGVGSALAPWYG